MAKRRGFIHQDANFVIDRSKDELRINVDGGRCTRPLFLVENNKIKLSHEDLKNEKLTLTNLL
jgi:hypothetical protein